jgi:hypothetical protein
LTDQYSGRIIERLTVWAINGHAGNRRSSSRPDISPYPVDSFDKVAEVSPACIVDDLDTDNVGVFSYSICLSCCECCNISSVTIAIHLYVALSCPAERRAAFKLVVLRVNSAVDNVNIDTITCGLHVQVGVSHCVRVRAADRDSAADRLEVSFG